MYDVQEDPFSEKEAKRFCPLVSFVLVSVPVGTAHAGRPTLAPEAAQALIQSARRPPAPGYDLTGRELEVLALMVEGLSNPEIAERLVVSRSAAKFHVSNVLSKLGAARRTETVSLALKHNLIS